MDESLPPWLRPDLLPEKPDAKTCGYMVREAPTTCLREELLDRVRVSKAPLTLLVWAPEVSRVVPAIELPFLHTAIRNAIQKTIHSRLTMAAICGFVYALPVLIGAFGGGGRAFEWQFLLLLSFGILPFVEGSWELRQLRHETPEAQSAKVVSARYALWIQQQDKPVTLGLVIIVATIFFLEMGRGLGFSIQRAGLIKTGLQGHDAYRFLTAPLMHANFMHLLMNGVVLFFLGMALEALLGSEGLALVFTISALCGSGLSFAFTSQTSVGASGGIMGMIGCLAVLGFHFRKTLPPRFGLQMIYAVFLTALTGLAARHVIDNAAHAGGLLGGALVGGLLVCGQQTLPLRLALLIRWAGRLSLALVLAAAVLIVLLMLRRV